MGDSKPCSNDGDPYRHWIILLNLVGSVIGCPSPEAFHRLRWLIGLTLVGIFLAIVLVVVLRVPVPAMPDLPVLPGLPALG